jgi:tetratricopeptide (TPR) repeat protein
VLALAHLALLANLESAPRLGPRARPSECNFLPGERGANVWERAKVPELRRYCDLVASGFAKLAPGSRMVAEVVQIADHADALVPGRAAPMLLKGRALCRLGRFPEARVALAAAHDRDDRALDDPAALLAWARSLEATGDALLAAGAYRTLLPRAEALSLADRGVAYLGAGMLAMSRGEGGLGEAIAILRQARHESQDLLHAAASFELALALDRAGDSGEAVAVLAEEGPGDGARVLADPRVVDALGVAGRKEVHATLALVEGALGRQEKARAEWEAYVTGGGTWAAHARASMTRAAPARAGVGHP